MNKVFSWIEIPVENMERAVEFYGKLLDRELTIVEAPPRRMATLYFEPGEVGGSLLQAPDIKPGGAGAHIYLNAGKGDALNTMIAHVQSIGGEIVLPRTRMGDDGYFASFKDSEGNTLSLFAEN